MKKLWTLISTIAFLNLLAVVGFAAWLYSSGRVDSARIQEVQSLFGETVEERDQRVEEEEKAAADALNNAEKALPEIALTADERNRVRVEMTQIDRQRRERTEREIDDLKASLMRQQRMIDADREALREEQRAFDEMRERLEIIEGADQFAKSLSVLSGLKPKDAMNALQALLDQGKDEQVVSYLSKMDERVRTKVFAEFVKVDKQLAANLLESLRTRGLAAAPAG